MPSGSQFRRDTEGAAVLCTLREPAKLVGVEPKGYLLRALQAAVAQPGTITLSRPANDLNA